MKEQSPAATLDRSGLRALWLGLGALLLTLFFAPAGLAAGIAAVVVAVKARRNATGAVPGAVAGLVMGVAGALLSAVVLAMTVFLWSELNGYQECLTTANTKTDEQACKDTWMPRMEDRLNMPRGSLDQYGDLL
ncbi:hypothetical protein [Actinocorallia libanotica]|uniref:DUF4190 domain-containing protein n=1 Tax=Actinocorallia libanotica TaxID=46162 RepID=A0ABN1RLI3_9ACTN